LGSQIIDVRYEDLVANPTGVVESIYQQLDLGGFESIRDSLTKRIQDEKEYKTNRFGLDEATETLVLQNWKTYAERYGYA
jgi:LPS sulfotransferase NodH